MKRRRTHDMTHALTGLEHTPDISVDRLPQPPAGCAPRPAQGLPLGGC
ncbi:hypothetical protein SAMN05216359_11152 [Roseateles sp. YR242]|nr:hypothetical protein SAMN05216359_11152 [Roseateles sp. YR242]